MFRLQSASVILKELSLELHDEQAIRVSISECKIFTEILIAIQTKSICWTTVEFKNLYHWATLIRCNNWYSTMYGTLELLLMKKGKKELWMCKVYKREKSKISMLDTKYQNHEKDYHLPLSVLYFLIFLLLIPTTKWKYSWNFLCIPND